MEARKTDKIAFLRSFGWRGRDCSSGRGGCSDWGGYDNLFFLIDSTRVCLQADGNEPVEELQISIHMGQNPWEGVAWAAEPQRRMPQHLRREVAAVGVARVGWGGGESVGVQEGDSSGSDASWMRAWVGDTIKRSGVRFEGETMMNVWSAPERVPRARLVCALRLKWIPPPDPHYFSYWAVSFPGRGAWFCGYPRLGASHSG